MLTAADSENDLPVFPFLGSASKHDSISFLYNWFYMKQFLSKRKSQSSSWTLHMTPCLIMNTAVNIRAFHSLISMPTGDVHLYTRMPLPSMMTVSLYAGKAMPCAGTARNPPKEGQNSNAQKSALPVAMWPVPVKIHALMLNMSELYTLP